MATRTLLIVDDNLLIRQVLVDLFEAAGWTVSTAVDGAEAVKALHVGIPDLIIADVVMPVMDGWALCEEVRRNMATCRIPLIFLTAERDVPKRIRGLQMGADDFVGKPFSKEELLARAESVVRRAGARGDGATGFAAGAMRPEDVSLAGHSDHMQISDLLQMLSTGDRAGTIHVRGPSVGRIFIRQGRIINAETSGQRGQKAFYRIMSWQSVRFEFEPDVLPEGLDELLSGTTSSLLMEGFTHMDELGDRMSGLPALTRRVRASSSHQGHPSGADDASLSTTHRLMLRAAEGGGCSVASLLDAVPDSDLEAYAVLGDLLNRGLLELLDSEPAVGR